MRIDSGDAVWKMRCHGDGGRTAHGTTHDIRAVWIRTEIVLCIVNESKKILFREIVNDDRLAAASVVCDIDIVSAPECVDGGAMVACIF